MCQAPGQVLPAYCLHLISSSSSTRSGFSGADDNNRFREVRRLSQSTQLGQNFELKLLRCRALRFNPNTFLPLKLIAKTLREAEGKGNFMGFPTENALKTRSCKNNISTGERGARDSWGRPPQSHHVDETLSDPTVLGSVTPGFTKAV